MYDVTVAVAVIDVVATVVVVIVCGLLVNLHLSFFLSFFLLHVCVYIICAVRLFQVAPCLCLSIINHFLFQEPHILIG